MKVTAGLLLLLTCFSLTAADEREWSKIVPVDAGVSFSLDSHKGNINITIGADNEISMQARVYFSDSADIPEDRVGDLLDALNFNLSQSRQSVRLEVEYDRDFQKSWNQMFKRGFEMPMVDLEITIPDDSNLNLETHKSTFEVDAPVGNVRVETHKGQGVIRQVRNNFDLETHKGKVKVEIQDLHDVDVETHKGDVTLKIFDAGDFTLRGDSHKGNFNFKGLDIRAKKDDGELIVRHTEGSGRNRIDLETHKGDIRIEFN